MLSSLPDMQTVKILANTFFHLSFLVEKSGTKGDGALGQVVRVSELLDTCIRGNKAAEQRGDPEGKPALWSGIRVLSKLPRTQSWGRAF